MSIRTKILGISGVLIAVLVGLGVFVMVTLGGIREDSVVTSTIAKDEVILLDLEGDITQAQLAMEQAVFTFDPEKQGARIDLFEDNIIEVRDNVQLYSEVRIAVDGEPELFAQLAPATEAWAASSIAIIEQVRGGALGTELSDSLDAQRPQFVEAARVADDLADLLEDKFNEVEGDVVDSVDAARGILTILVVLGALLGAVAAWFTAVRITQPLGRVTDAANRLAVGEPVDDLTHTSRDETGALADSFRSLSSYLAGAAGTAEEIAAGRLVERPEPRSERDVLGHALVELHDGLSDIVGQARTMSGEVTSNAAHLTASASDAAASSGEVARAVGAVAEDAENQLQASSAMADATADIRTDLASTADAVEHVSDAVGSLADKARVGNEQVEAVRGAMDQVVETISRTADLVDGLGSRSQEVAEAVGLIRDIAEQTNLLALNAAIEAARAGEQGRGFAVVASEVKALAGEAADSTSRIADIVEQMTDAVGDTVEAGAQGRASVNDASEAVAGAAETFGEIQSSMAAVVDELDSVRSATVRVREATDSIGEQTESLVRSSEQNGAATEEMAAAAEQSTATATQVGDAATRLDEVGKRLEAVMDRFELSDA